MPATLVTAPPYPIPTNVCKITFSGLHADTNKIQLFPVSAPEGSAIREGLDAAKGQRISTYGPMPSNEPWVFTPEVGGVYTFTLQETKVSPSSFGMWQNSPTGAPQPVITQTSVVKLYVGEAMELPIGDRPDDVRLRVFVWNDTIRATSIPVHGEATPAFVAHGSLAAENASLDSELLDSVIEIVDKPIDTICKTLPADFNSIRAKYMAHIASTGAHTNADNINTIGTSWTAGNSAAALRSITELRTLLESHTSQLLNGSDPPVQVHLSVDGTSSYLSSGASQRVGEQFFALADAFVRLVDHAAIASPVHSSSSAITGTFGLLTTICINYIRALQSQAPNTPVTKNSAVAILSQFGGFEEANPS